MPTNPDSTSRRAAAQLSERFSQPADTSQPERSDPTPIRQPPRQTWHDSHRTYSFAIASDLLARLNAVSTAKGLSRASIINEAIARELDRLENSHVPPSSTRSRPV